MADFPPSLRPQQLSNEREGLEAGLEAEEPSAAKRTFITLVRDNFSLLTVSGCLVGALIGYGARVGGLDDAGIELLGFVGELFVRSLKATLSPMIFCSMICCTNLHAHATSSAVPKWSLVFYSLSTFLAAVAGVAAFELLHPGSEASSSLDGGEPVQHGGGAAAEGQGQQQHARLIDTFLELGRAIVPDNLLRALVEMQLLSIITAGVAIGLAIRHTSAMHPDATAPMLAIAKGTFEALLSLISALVLGAPLGVCSMVASCVAATPDLAAVASGLSMMVLTSAVGMLFHVCVSLALLLLVSAPRRNPWRYLRGMAPAATMAFGTASSAATLTTTMDAVVAQGVRREIASFVLPLGATVNMDGAAIGMTVSVLYLAHVGGELAAMNALDVANVGLVCALLSVGAAPVPSSGLVTLLLCLEASGVRIGGHAAYVLAIDWLTDRMRTSVNVLGDAMVCACVDARVPGAGGGGSAGGLEPAVEVIAPSGRRSAAPADASGVQLAEAAGHGQAEAGPRGVSSSRVAAAGGKA
jgi:Na+/H+-dicarboxylate symporter